MMVGNHAMEQLSSWDPCSYRLLELLAGVMPVFRSPRISPSQCRSSWLPAWKATLSSALILSK